MTSGEQPRSIDPQVRIGHVHEKFVEDLAKGQGTGAATVEAEFFRSARPTSLIRRFAAPEEVAALVAYVCSPRASTTNGAALRVDGGLRRPIL